MLGCINRHAFRLQNLLYCGRNVPQKCPVFSTTFFLSSLSYHPLLAPLCSSLFLLFQFLFPPHVFPLSSPLLSPFCICLSLCCLCSSHLLFTWLAPDCFQDFFSLSSSIHCYGTRQSTRGDLFLAKLNHNSTV